MSDLVIKAHPLMALELLCRDAANVHRKALPIQPDTLEQPHTHPKVIMPNARHQSGVKLPSAGPRHSRLMSFGVIKHH